VINAFNAFKMAEEFTKKSREKITTESGL